MKNFDFKQQVLPHLLVVLCFALALSLYFSDSVFQGKSLKQSDAVQWAGSSREIVLHREKYGEEPLWTNGMFGGMPAYTISTLYDGELLEHLENISTKIFPYPVSILFVGLVCSYIMLLAFGLGSIEAAIGAIAFTFFSFSFVSIEAGHNSKVRAMTFAPLLIAGIAHAYKGRYLWGFALAALGTALQIRSGHYQITYYLGFIVVFFGIAELVNAIRSGTLKNFALATVLLIAAAGLGVATNAARLMVLQEYTQYSMRGKPELITKSDNNKPKDGGLDRDYVFSWSHLKMETLTLLIPHLYGGSTSEKVEKKSAAYEALTRNNVDPSQVSSLPYYWGDQPFTSGPVYAGAVVMFLFVLGAFFVDTRYRWWLLGASLFGMMLAMGKHLEILNYTMYDYFPGYNKFRTVTMSIFIAQICMPILAALGLKKITEIEFDEANKKKLYTATGIIAGLCAIFILAPSIAGDFSAENDTKNGLPEWLLSAVQEDRESMVRADALRSILLIGFAFGAIWAILNKKLQPTVGFAIIGVLVLFDLWSVDKRYLNKENFEKKFWATQFEPTEADNFIRADSGVAQYRVLNLDNPFAETHTSYYFHSLGGYSPVKIRRYQDLIENDLTEEIQAMIKDLNSGAFNSDSAFLKGMQKYKVINMLNTKYIKAGETRQQVLQNPAAMGNAWFVSNVKSVSSPNEELEAVRSIDQYNDAVVDVKKFKISTTEFNNKDASIKMVGYKSNELTYECNNSGNGLAVFSEIYYPEGWEFYIDDKPASLIRANYVFRAAEIPAGKHKLVMKFHPKSYYVGNEIGRYASLAIYLMLIGAVIISFRGNKKKEE